MPLTLSLSLTHSFLATHLSTPLGDVCVTTWNENYRKLTTSDQYGLIIVWMLHKGMWFEEMINNRNKSVVSDMKWNADGQKICICYEDGAVIVGSVDGNRMWGKELDIGLKQVEWSPNGRSILFGTTNHEVHIFDAVGQFIAKVPLPAVSDLRDIPLAAVEWYNGLQGYIEPQVPSLAIAFENGRVQIMRHEMDEQPVLINTGLNICTAKWNSNGSILAVAGATTASRSTTPSADSSSPSPSSSAASQVVQFYTPFGKHLKTLKVPGKQLTTLTWEGHGLRLALGVDSYIYFANIRPDYNWAYFSKTVVYSFSKPDRVENCVTFWDTATNQKYVKYVKRLIGVGAAGDYCVFATKADDNSNQHILIICNAIGSPIDSMYIDVEPQFLTMTSSHIVVASSDYVYVWQYKPQNQLPGLLSRSNEGRETLFHIDKTPDMSGLKKSDRVPLTLTTNDPITAITASDRVLMVSRASGTLMRYSLPHLSLDGKYTAKCRPNHLRLNCNSTRLSIIDINGILSCLDLDARPEGSKGALGQFLDFSRKDAWDVVWSSDNPELFAVMEKAKMYVIRGTKPEEPISSSGYLCDFDDLCITAVHLDEVMLNPENPTAESMLSFETKSLRDTRQLLATCPIEESYQFVADNPHPRLWRILAEAALEQLNFVLADKAFVHCEDYQGIQFVKRLKLLTDRNRQKAEVAAHFGNFEEAERIYRELGQMDLAVELRTQLGDWFRVLVLVEEGAGDDRVRDLAYDKIGDYYAERQKWDRAYNYYAKSRNLKRMCDAAYKLDDYSALTRAISQASSNASYLSSVGERFMSVGLCTEAVHTYEKAGNYKAAIDCCVLLNQWDQAIELAEKYQFPQIETLLTKYANYLMGKNQIYQAVELYRKANRHMEAARLLGQLASEIGKKGVFPLRAKQLYVLGGLEMEKYKSKTLGQQLSTGIKSTQKTLQTLLDHDSSTSSGGEMVGTPWHGAEAYHFLLLAHRQLYASEFDAAMKTALRLTQYEDVLSVKEIYSIVALSTFQNRFFNECSRALIRLETDVSLSEEDREKYQKMALHIFMKHDPEDPKVMQFRCPNPKCDGKVRDFDTSCEECSRPIEACIVTGRSILKTTNTAICKVCKHKMTEQDSHSYTNCPLCHSTLHRNGPSHGSSARADMAAAILEEDDEEDDEII